MADNRSKPQQIDSGISFIAHIKNPNEQQQRGNMRRATATFQQHLHLPDPAPLHMLWATVAANLANPSVDLKPVWLMLVGPPGCGKSTMLESLADVPNTHCAGTLTAPGLLNGVPKENSSSGMEVTGGLLHTLIGQNGFGFIVIPEMSNILSMDRHDRPKLLNGLRCIADNHWERGVGTMERQLCWQGKCCIVAGATDVIDSHRSGIATMGERFVYFHVPGGKDARYYRNAWTKKYIKAGGCGLKHSAIKRRELREASNTALHHIVANTVRPVELTDAETQHLYTMALWCGWARSSVEREGGETTSENARMEAPYRLTEQFQLLFAALLRMGVPNGDAWGYMRRLVWDTIPTARREILEYFLAHRENQKNGADHFVNQLKAGRRTIQHALEDLYYYGLLTRHGMEKRHTYGLSDEAVETWKDAFSPPPTRGDVIMMDGPEGVEVGEEEEN